MLDIDGSVLEGGGQVLRIAVALSAILRKPVKIRNIRGKRSKPGLKQQHMCGLKLVQQLVDDGAKLSGCHLGSSEIIFDPCPRRSGQENCQQSFEMDITTAGSTTLLAQIALPVALYRPCQTVLDLKGGTHVPFAPQYEYYDQVFSHLFQSLFADDLKLFLLKRGYYPKGGGHFQLTINPLRKPLPPTCLLLAPATPVEVVAIHASTAGRVPTRVAQQMATSAADLVMKTKKVEASIITQHFADDKAFANGSTIFIKANVTALGNRGQTIKTVIASSGIGDTKEKAEITGRKAAEELLAQLHCPIDQYLQDQFIIFMSLAEGHSRLQTGQPLTLHTQTAIHIAGLLTGAKFNVTEENIIECQGIGFYP